MKIGIWDTDAECWMGNDKGPLCFTDRELAQAALTILFEQFGSLTRFRAAELPEGEFTAKDELHAPMSAEEAIKRIEGRAE